MTATTQDTIIANVVAILTTGNATFTPPTGLTVHRARAIPLGQDKLPAIVVYPIRDVQLERVGLENAPVSNRRLTFRCECRVVVKISLGDSVDKDLDPLIAYAVQALNIDPTLGDLVSGLQESDVMWAAAAGLDKVYGGAAIDFTAHYGVLAADPTQSTP